MMVHVTKTSVLIVLFMASSAVANVMKPESDADFKAFVEGQLKQTCMCGYGCPKGWVRFEGRCFNYFSQKMDWASAEAHCLNLDANLVSIHNEYENKMVKALIHAHDPTENPTWTGLSDCQKTNGWIWSDGTKFGYSKWNPNEPNHSGGECCGHINWKSETTAQKDWNDIACDKLYPFVCARRL
ncbi:hypothetical protein NFI96_028301, partial [Prochilodus magdalenae]